MDERKEVILRTYKNVWKFEREIYSIEGIKLLLPVKPNEVLYFIISVVISMFLVKLIPFMDRVNFVVKYGLIPFGIMKFLTKQKLDGKLPHKFFIDFIIYKLSPKKLERFRPIEESKKPIRFTTSVVCRLTAFFNKTEEAMDKKAKERSKTKKKKLDKKKLDKKKPNNKKPDKRRVG